MTTGNLFIDLDPRETITIGNVKVSFHKKLGRKVRLKIIADKAIPIKRDGVTVEATAKHD